MNALATPVHPDAGMTAQRPEDLPTPDHLARLGDWLDSHAKHWPDRAALEFETLSLSYAELRAQVDRCARAYLARGVRPGDCIAMLSPPRAEAFISFLAAARIGALWLGLNPRYKLPELSYVVGDARPVLLVCIDSFEDRDYEPDLEALSGSIESLRETVIFRPAPGGGSDFGAWVDRHADAVTSAALAEVAAQVPAKAPALLVYTSGSSGKPKGVLLGHRSLIRRSRTQNARFPTRDYPRVLDPLPVNHIGGMHFLGLFTFIGGGTLRLAERFSAPEFVRALQDRSINVMIVLPTMFKMMLDQPDFSPELLGRLEWFVFSGAAMAPELIELIRATGCPLGLTYGMTETCGSVTYSDPDADVETLANTIGRPCPEGEVRVAGDDGVPTPAGTPGEIQVRAEFSMSGYLNRPDATREAYTEDGWLRTGDTAILREDGNIRFVGRRSEMFKSGGYNVYPREVELALETHESVVLSAVVSVPDPLFDEVGWAYVVPAPGLALTEGEIAAWCRAQLANYKVPKRFFICSELPLLPIGKVDKVLLRTQARDAAVRGV